MKVTNIEKLPDSLFRVLSTDRYTKRADYSVTELINPPQIVQLTRRHWDELTEDASERIWMLLGESVHAIISYDDNPNVLQEEPLVVDFKTENGVISVSGTPDHLEGTTLDDYKVTSVWKIINDGASPEWEAQINCYADMYREHGFDVGKARIIAILRDWSKGKASREPSYPQSQVKVLNVKLWPAGEGRAFLENRVKVHEAAKHDRDNELPECTFEERWGRPTKFAVIKTGAKKAKRVLDTLSEAEIYIELNKLPNQYYVEERPGGFARCEAYCVVSHVCTQWNSGK